MNNLPNEEPDYKILYEIAQLDLENLKGQLEHWELKAGMLRKLIEQQYEFATAIELKIELLKSGTIDIKRLSLK
ncbi:hypothetical protein [Pedobacter heparinus]|uniref:hypothetical protein n=1 Tax=Pedobacter heparinus TaxID=984 RepID=UPI00292F7545|nr:hypothetical protein [Pedobacter heparinus]